MREFQETPNPGAIKCLLEPAIAPLAPGRAGPRSYRSAAAASSDPLAARLFEVAGVENVLIATDWITIGKSPSASWKTVKKDVERALAAASD
ncbi:MAG: NifU N-terminal domain-containing protein [Phycisphaerales bacterium]